MDRRGLVKGFVAGGIGVAAAQGAKAEPISATKVVYHLADAEKVGFVLGNLRNHLADTGDASSLQLAVVVHGPALHVFRADSGNRDLREATLDAVKAGVAFYACAHTMAAQLASLVLEGIPERFPRLKIVFIEGGLGWIPSTTWRMDQHFERFRSEVPHLKRKPSEYVKQHFWFTTQPSDEPDEARHLRSLIDWVGVDRMLFSSDYPHWDWDDPRFVLKTPLSETERTKIFNSNARALYKL